MQQIRLPIQTPSIFTHTRDNWHQKWLDWIGQINGLCIVGLWFMWMDSHGVTWSCNSTRGTDDSHDESLLRKGGGQYRDRPRTKGSRKCDWFGRNGHHGSEANREKSETVAEHQEIPNEEAAVETIGVQKGWDWDRHLAAGHGRQPKIWTHGNGGSRQKLVTIHRWMTRHAETAQCKGCGHKGPMEKSERRRFYTRNP
jgi:hypothetical protein